MEMRMIGLFQLEIKDAQRRIRAGDPNLVDHNVIPSAAQSISKGIA
ncbi:MAG: hypothetical protein ACYDBH_14395 [Acidobacteriaceae bacterium]